MMTYNNRNRQMYNVQAISFLLDSFIDLVESYGQKKETVVFYKQQVHKMIMNGNVAVADVKFIYDLLGINNTEAIKWQQTTTKVDQFLNGVHFINDIDNPNQRVSMVNMLVNNGSISNSVGSLIKKICV